MKTAFIIGALALLVSAGAGFSAETGRRAFIGTNLNYYTPEKFTSAEGCSLLYADNFDDQELSGLWEKAGSLEFYEINRQIKIPVRTLKMEPKEGSLLFKKSVDCRINGVRLTVDMTLPTNNTELSSALLFFPEKAAIGPDGLPAEFIRYYKRAQMEMVEAREAGEPVRLIYARNQKTESGAPHTYVLQLDAKNVSLTLDGKSVFSGAHDVRIMDNVRCGLWVATKGTSHSGGNVAFDNFILETVFAAEEPQGQ
jgi:hypothetical protein